MCQTVFAGKGITNHMAPKVAVENIKNLIVSSTEMECLMAKVGSGYVLQATPFHLPRDIAIFPLQDIISGP